MIYTSKYAPIAVRLEILEQRQLLSLGGSGTGIAAALDLIDRPYGPAAVSMSPTDDTSASPADLAVSAAATATSDAAVNLESNGFWSTGPVWTDVTRLLNPWGRYDSPWAFDSSIPLTADSYPLVDAGAGTPMTGYPLGTYTLRYEGTGEVTVAGLGHLAGPAVRGADGVWQAQVVVDRTYEESGAQLYLKIRNPSASDPIRGVRIIMPGYDPVDPPTFADEFLTRLRPFSTIRFMDWGRTNGNPLRGWSERTTESSILQTTTKGVAYEHMIALANEAGKDLWINVPLQADDQFVRELARLVAGSLDPGLDVYVEYSNELWNNGFSHYWDNAANAWANPLLTRGDELGRAAEQAAYKTMQIGQVFRAEFGAAADRVRPIFSGQAGWDFFMDTGLQYLASRYGDPTQYLAGVAVAPYLVTAPSLSTAGLTLDGLMDSLRNESLPETNRWIDQSKAVADRYRLPLLAYEGGQHLTAWDPATVELFRQAQHDPRMGDILRDHFAHWQAVGGRDYAYYNLAGLEKSWGTWGALTSLAEPGSVKWDAILSSFLTAGDSTLDGAVNYDDFAVLSRNYKQTGRWWWEQGDLDADNLVDDGDLVILRRNLVGLTPWQAVEVALLDAPGSLAPATPVTINAGGLAGNLTYSWSVTKNGAAFASATINPGGDAAFTFRPDGEGTYVISLGVRDASGTTNSGSKTIRTAGAGGETPGGETPGGETPGGETPGDFTYLSDLPFATAIGSHGPVERDQSNGDIGLGDGQPLRGGGVAYAKGIGAHSGSDVRVDLGGRYGRFRAVLGLDDAVGDRGSVVFQVWADGVLLYDSGVLTGAMAGVPIDVDVSGRSALRLVVTDGGDNNWYDHADWADARLTRVV